MAHTNPCHVLHVENDHGDAVASRRVLERLERPVTLSCSEDGESAVEYLRDGRQQRAPVNAVRLDWKRPRMQGAGVLRAIRTDASLSKTPVVALTSSRDEGTAFSRRQPGVNGDLLEDHARPVHVDKIGTMIEPWCCATTATFSAAAEPPNDTGLAASPRRHGSDQGDAQSGARILIVDDSAADVSMISRYLENMDGIEVMSASETGEAEALLSRDRFDIVLLDYRMPGTSGLDYLEVLRRRDPDIGVILITAFSNENVAIRSIRRRVDDLLRKEELSPELLCEAVERLLVRVKRRRSAPLDAVTGLYESSTTEELLQESCERMKRLDEQFCLLLVDLEQFHKINDAHGYVTGDRVLRRLAMLLVDLFRPADNLGRYFEDEFCIIAANTDAASGTELAERVRQSIREIEFDYGDGPFRIDCAIGVAHFSEQVPDSPGAAIGRARVALRQAKAPESARISVYSDASGGPGSSG